MSDELEKNKSKNGKKKGETIGEDYRIGYLKKFTARVPQNTAHWIAFYGDCQHEVLPVLYGYRFTLTYCLYRPRETGILLIQLLMLYFMEELNSFESL